MDELNEIRQDLIIDHSRRPRNYGPLDDYSHQARGDNPLCGDRFVVQLRLDGDRIEDVRFTGEGCGMSTASASAMTEAVKGQTLAHAKADFERFRAIVVDRSVELDVDEMDRLAIIATGARQPMRAKCLTLAWHTLQAALEGGDCVTTE